MSRSLQFSPVRYDVPNATSMTDSLDQSLIGERVLKACQAQKHNYMFVFGDSIRASDSEVELRTSIDNMTTWLCNAKGSQGSSGNGSGGSSMQTSRESRTNSHKSSLCKMNSAEADSGVSSVNGTRILQGVLKTETCDKANKDQRTGQQLFSPEKKENTFMLTTWSQVKMRSQPSQERKVLYNDQPKSNSMPELHKYTWASQAQALITSVNERLANTQLHTEARNTGSTEAQELVTSVHKMLASAEHEQTVPLFSVKGSSGSLRNGGLNKLWESGDVAQTTALSKRLNGENITSDSKPGCSGAGVSNVKIYDGASQLLVPESLSKNKVEDQSSLLNNLCACDQANKVAEKHIVLKDQRLNNVLFTEASMGESNDSIECDMQLRDTLNSCTQRLVKGWLNTTNKARNTEQEGAIPKRQYKLVSDTEDTALQKNLFCSITSESSLVHSCEGATSIMDNVRPQLDMCRIKQNCEKNHTTANNFTNGSCRPKDRKKMSTKQDFTTPGGYAMSYPCDSKAIVNNGSEDFVIESASRVYNTFPRCRELKATNRGFTAVFNDGMINNLHSGQGIDKNHIDVIEPDKLTVPTAENLADSNAIYSDGEFQLGENARSFVDSITGSDTVSQDNIDSNCSDCEASIASDSELSKRHLQRSQDENTHSNGSDASAGSTDSSRGSSHTNYEFLNNLFPDKSTKSKDNHENLNVYHTGSSESTHESANAGRSEHSSLESISNDLSVATDSETTNLRDKFRLSLDSFGDSPVPNEKCAQTNVLNNIREVDSLPNTPSPMFRDYRKIALKANQQPTNSGKNTNLNLANVAAGVATGIGSSETLNKAVKVSVKECATQCPPPCIDQSLQTSFEGCWSLSERLEIRDTGTQVPVAMMTRSLSIDLHEIRQGSYYSNETLPDLSFLTKFTWSTTLSMSTPLTITSQSPPSTQTVTVGTEAICGSTGSIPVVDNWDSNEEMPGADPSLVSEQAHITSLSPPAKECQKKMEQEIIKNIHAAEQQVEVQSDNSKQQQDLNNLDTNNICAHEHQNKLFPDCLSTESQEKVGLVENISLADCNKDSRASRSVDSGKTERSASERHAGEWHKSKKKWLSEEVIVRKVKRDSGDDIEVKVNIIPGQGSPEGTIFRRRKSLSLPRPKSYPGCHLFPFWSSWLCNLPCLFPQPLVSQPWCTKSLTMYPTVPMYHHGQSSCSGESGIYSDKHSVSDIERQNSDKVDCGGQCTASETNPPDGSSKMFQHRASDEKTAEESNVQQISPRKVVSNSEKAISQESCSTVHRTPVSARVLEENEENLTTEIFAKGGQPWSSCSALKGILRKPCAVHRRPRSCEVPANYPLLYNMKRKALGDTYNGFTGVSELRRRSVGDTIIETSPENSQIRRSNSVTSVPVIDFTQDLHKMDPQEVAHYYQSLVDAVKTSTEETTEGEVVFPCNAALLLSPSNKGPSDEKNETKIVAAHSASDFTQNTAVDAAKESKHLASTVASSTTPNHASFGTEKHLSLQADVDDTACCMDTLDDNVFTKTEVDAVHNDKQGVITAKQHQPNCPAADTAENTSFGREQCHSWPEFPAGYMPHPLYPWCVVPVSPTCPASFQPTPPLDSDPMKVLYNFYAAHPFFKDSMSAARSGCHCSCTCAVPTESKVKKSVSFNDHVSIQHVMESPDKHAAIPNAAESVSDTEATADNKRGHPISSVAIRLVKGKYIQSLYGVQTMLIYSNGHMMYKYRKLMLVVLCNTGNSYKDMHTKM